MTRRAPPASLRTCRTVLRAETRLTLPDCCVLLAAQDVGADAVLTFDERLQQVASAAGYAVSITQ